METARAVAGPLLSIGALSRAAGIPVQTLRTWETRYGFPEAVRRPSGHRVYPVSVVTHLRRIAEAIARGHRAGQVVLKLKTAYRDGTSHLVMSPLEFMQRLAALVPRPRLHLKFTAPAHSPMRDRGLLADEREGLPQPTGHSAFRPPEFR